MNRLHLSCVLFFAVVVGQQSSHADWPQFRGPDGEGHAGVVKLPTDWSETRNVAWKTAIPGLGWSSPVVIDNDVWMTTATDRGLSLRVICVDLTSGKVTHNIEVFRRDETEEKHTQNSFASPTPVVTNAHVYVHFGAAGTACVARSGDVIWRRTDFTYESPHGPAASPVLYDDRLIICCDGSDRQFVAALDVKSGRTVWRTDRLHLEDARRKSAAEKDASRKGLPFIAFSTPLVIGEGQDAILVSTPADHVAAYRVDNGEEVWWHPYNCFSLVARPVTGNGLIFAIGGIRDGHYKLFAFRRGGVGRVAEQELAWSTQENVPQIVSPITVGQEIYLFKRNGVATCLNAVNGKLHWKRRIGGNYRASPIEASGRIYLLSQEGKMTILSAGKEYDELATNQLDGIFLASPAVAGDSLVIRSDKHLYRIHQ